MHQRPLGGDAGGRVAASVSPPSAFSIAASSTRASSAKRPLSGGRHELDRARRRRLVEPEPLEPRDRQHERVALSLARACAGGCRRCRGPGRSSGPVAGASSCAARRRLLVPTRAPARQRLERGRAADRVAGDRHAAGSRPARVRPGSPPERPSRSGRRRRSRRPAAHAPALRPTATCRRRSHGPRRCSSSRSPPARRSAPRPTRACASASAEPRVPSRISAGAGGSSRTSASSGSRSASSSPRPGARLRRRRARTGHGSAPSAHARGRRAAP